MAILIEQTIDQSKVKSRWDEPYTSLALNRLGGAFPKGIFSGFHVTQSVVPDKSIWFRVDDGTGDKISLMVFNDSQDGYGLVLAETVDVEVDLSAIFSDGGTPPSTMLVYVYAVVNYQVDSLTTVKYVLADTAPTPASVDHVMLTVLALDDADTSIVTANIGLSETWRQEPVPSKVESTYLTGYNHYGFLSGIEAWRIPTLDQKKALNAADSPSAANPYVTRSEALDKTVGEATIAKLTMSGANTKIQLPGVYFIGEVSAGHGLFGVSNYFELLESHNGKPMNDVTNGERIYCKMVTSTESNYLDASDADADGFYANPWVYFYYGKDGDFDSATLADATDVYIRCTKKGTLDSLTANHAGTANSTTPIFSERVYCRFDAATKPYALGNSQQRLDGYLESFLGWINSLTAIQSTDGASVWTLIWRNTFEEVGTWSKDSVAIYGNRDARMTVKGAGSSGWYNLKIGTVGTPEHLLAPITMMLVGNLNWFGLLDGKYVDKHGVFYGVRTSAGHDVLAGTSFDWRDLTQWDHWTFEIDGVKEFSNTKISLDASSFLKFTTAPAGNDLQKVFSNDASTRKPAILAGNSALWLTNNISYNSATNLFEQVDAAGPSRAIGIGDSGLLFGQVPIGHAAWNPSSISVLGWMQGFQWDHTQLGVSQLRDEEMLNNDEIEIGPVGTEWAGFAIIREHGTNSTEISAFTGSTAALLTTSMGLLDNNGTPNSTINYWNDSGTFKVKNLSGATRNISLALIGML